MNLKDISTIKLGSQDVKAIYKGSEQIWPNYLLNQFPGAAVAYSLRQLSSDTTNVVRVRRSSDNVEQDFTAEEITDGTLTTFTGANDGFVSIWYDQSGNDNHATQVTASNQPKIVDAGSVVIENGKPALDFDGVDDGLVNSSQLLSKDISHSIFSVWRTNDLSLEYRTVVAAAGGNNDRVGVVIRNTSVRYGVYDGSSYIHANSGEISIDNQYLSSVFYESLSSSDLYINSSEQVGNETPALNFIQETTIGAQTNLDDKFWEGIIQEVILYPSDQSSNRTPIEQNINEYYNIY